MNTQQNRGVLGPAGVETLAPKVPETSSGLKNHSPEKNRNSLNVRRESRRIRKQRNRAAREATQLVAPGLAVLKTPKPRLAQPRYQKEDWHRRQQLDRQRTKAKAVGQARRKKPDRKFDSTLGYPGEGPGVQPKRPGKDTQKWVTPCPKAESGECRRRTHYHRKKGDGSMAKKPHEGAKKRLAEKMTKRFTICRTPDSCSKSGKHHFHCTKAPEQKGPEGREEKIQFKHGRMHDAYADLPELIPDEPPPPQPSAPPASAVPESVEAAPLESKSADRKSVV